MKSLCVEGIKLGTLNFVPSSFYEIKESLIVSLMIFKLSNPQTYKLSSGCITHNILNCNIK